MDVVYKIKKVDINKEKVTFSKGYDCYYEVRKKALKMVCKLNSQILPEKVKHASEQNAFQQLISTSAMLEIEPDCWVGRDFEVKIMVIPECTRNRISSVRVFKAIEQVPSKLKDQVKMDSLKSHHRPLYIRTTE